MRSAARPLLVAAIVDGEPGEAVPADQVVVREGSDAELWVPLSPVRFRVWARDRELRQALKTSENRVDIEVR